ncbi:response regulator transcription factor [Novosphingobium flavum]|uniref:Regulatory protein VirG n=2 Tax=Novosphingobium flavum TaxID=1778672 RepID=A0A7X1FSD3_9SPHN|nr:response regulator transcription factor [Novosphingobium flavum]
MQDSGRPGQPQRPQEADRPFCEENLYDSPVTASRILLVEDDGPLRTLTTRNLREHGFEVSAVATGAEMWVTLENEAFDVILLDIMLPGSSGFDILRRLRQTQDVPVIFVSARGGQEDRIIGLELGADDFLPKPFNTRELVARIGAVLRRHKGEVRHQPEPADRNVTFEGWTLSRSRREVRAPSGLQVELTSAEFDLLSAFVSQPQRVIGRERLIELSRARLGESSDRSVDVLVSRLRAKLGAAHDTPLIRTVRGVGYMFTAKVDRS